MTEPFDEYDEGLDRFENSILIPFESGPSEETNQPVERELTGYHLNKRTYTSFKILCNEIFLEFLGLWFTLVILKKGKGMQ